MFPSISIVPVNVAPMPDLEVVMVIASPEWDTVAVIGSSWGAEDWDTKNLPVQVPCKSGPTGAVRESLLSQPGPVRGETKKEEK